MKWRLCDNPAEQPFPVFPEYQTKWASHRSAVSSFGRPSLTLAYRLFDRGCETFVLSPRPRELAVQILAGVSCDEEPKALFLSCSWCGDGLCGNASIRSCAGREAGARLPPDPCGHGRTFPVARRQEDCFREQGCRHYQLFTMNADGPRLRNHTMRGITTLRRGRPMARNSRSPPIRTSIPSSTS